MDERRNGDVLDGGGRAAMDAMAMYWTAMDARRSTQWRCIGRRLTRGDGRNGDVLDGN
jgi:hypothetical protein